MKNIFSFSILLGLSALFVAFCAAYFSVFGIGMLFSGASLSAIIMASSLELGKLVATTYLYRYWKIATSIMKCYLVSAILILMLITSLGIFGYLSAAYQKSSLEYSLSQEKIKIEESQKTFFNDKIVESKKRIDSLNSSRIIQENRLSEAMTNVFLSKNPIQLRQIQQQTIDLINDADSNIKEENDKIQSSISEIQKIDENINNIKLSNIEKKDIQTFKFVADELNMELNKVVKWFILLIIFVFDPLAVCLILAYNSTLNNVKKQKSEEKVEKINTTTTESKTQETPQKIEKETVQQDIPNNSKIEEETSQSQNLFYKSYFKK